ncbi:MAG: hypothetical protein NT085_02905 [candidate division SR1 bacterium]|nr:hypothetical protein [candidate division SR1 bacterium]
MDRQLENAIRNSWDKKTCYPPNTNKRSLKNSSLGQCAVTALVIQDYVGGKLLFCFHNNHYWNRLPNGEIVDLTKEQFPEGTLLCIDEIIERTSCLTGKSAIQAKTNERYQLLKSRVEKKIYV